jgi:hypothetical protein
MSHGDVAHGRRKKRSIGEGVVSYCVGLGDRRGNPIGRVVNMHALGRDGDEEHEGGMGGSMHRSVRCALLSIATRFRGEEEGIVFVHA